MSAHTVPFLPDRFNFCSPASVKLSMHGPVRSASRHALILIFSSFIDRLLYTRVRTATVRCNSTIHMHMYYVYLCASLWHIYVHYCWNERPTAGLLNQNRQRQREQAAAVMKPTSMTMTRSILGPLKPILHETNKQTMTRRRRESHQTLMIISDSCYHRFKTLN